MPYRAGKAPIATNFSDGKTLVTEAEELARL